MVGVFRRIYPAELALAAGTDKGFGSRFQILRMGVVVFRIPVFSFSQWLPSCLVQEQAGQAVLAQIHAACQRLPAK